MARSPGGRYGPPHHTGVMDERVLADVVAGEKRLLDPAFRADETSLRELLHPDFLEYGASGTVWTLDAVLRQLPRDPAVDGVGEGFAAVRLGEDVVLVTFRVTGGGHTSLRSSVWIRCPDGRWRLRFHQGTRTD